MPVVVSHGIAAAGRTARGVGIRAAAPAASLRGARKAVHLAAIDVFDECLRVVGAAKIDVARIVIGPGARIRLQIRQANGEVSVARRYPVGSRERSEVRIERSILLHDDDDVLDLMNGVVRRVGLGLRTGRAAAGDGDRHQQCGDHLKDSYCA